MNALFRSVRSRRKLAVCVKGGGIGDSHKADLWPAKLEDVYYDHTFLIISKAEYCFLTQADHRS